jgi:DNA-binding NarL/FixJ family response regulator
MMPNSAPIGVFVVAPAMLCWGFQHWVRAASPQVRLCGSGPSLVEALRVAGGTGADLLLVDFDEGVDVEAIATAARSFAVLLFTSRAHEPLARDAAQGLADAVVRKCDPASTLLAAIERAHVNRTHGRTISPGTDRHGTSATAVTEQIRFGTLTARERQLMLAVLCNETAPGKVIASQLRISEHTLRNHLTSIYGKLGVQNRLSLHAFAAKCQLDPLPGLDA